MTFARCRDARIGLAAPVQRAARAGFAASVWLVWFPSCLAQATGLKAVDHAAQIASSVGAGAAVPTLGAGAVLQTLTGLIIVIGLVLGCSWLARRFGLQPPGRGGLVKVIAGSSLGGKERVSVVEIGDIWLVLGSAPGSVRLLHTMPAGLPNADGAALDGESHACAGGTRRAHNPQSTLSGTFAQRFRSTLMSEARKRLQRRESADQ
jgi:flagellar protein FliO/FliZ